MLHATLRRLAARKLRLLTTGLAIVLGIAFMTGTLVLTDTIGRGFDAMTAGVDAGTDAYVRAAAGSDGGRARLDAALGATVAAVDGVAETQPRVQGFAQLTHHAGRALPGSGGMRQPLGMNWIDSERLNPFRLIGGAAPAHDGEVVVDTATATGAGIGVGDRVTVLTANGPADVTVSGIAAFGTFESPGGASVVLFTGEAAQRHLGVAGRVDGFAVAAAGGVGQDELAGRIHDRIGAGTEVITGAQLGVERGDAVREHVRFISTFLLAFAVIALFVGSFIIANTFSILITQRTKETATLRALGASRRQLLASALLEAGALGAVAAVAGVAAGIALAAGSLATLRAAGLDLPDGGVAVTPTAVITALATGIGVSVVAAVLPARRASAVAPLAALREVAVDDTGRSRRRVVAGTAVTGAGLVAFAAGFATAALPAVATGAAAVFLGITVLGPVIARPVAAVLGAPLARVRGVSGALARGNALRNPRRTATTAAALMVGVTLVSFMAVLAASAKASVADAVERGFAGDYAVGPASMMTPGLPEALAAEVAALPQIGTTLALRSSPAVVGGTRSQVAGTDVAALGALLDLSVRQGELAALDGGRIAIAEGEAAARAVEMGDTVEVAFPGAGARPFVVGAVYGDGDLVGPYLLGEATYRANVDGALVARVLVARDPGASATQARAALDALLADHPQAAVQDREEFVGTQTASIDQMLNLVYALLALAVLIALIGIANTTALSIIERTRELGLLRSVGMTRPQLRAAVRWEAVLVAMLGAVLGLVLGTTFGMAVARALAGEGITVVRVPAANLLAVAVLAAIAGAAAAVLPARRAARLDVLGALAAD